MKKFLLLFLLIPLNVFAIDQNKVNIRIDYSSIPTFKYNVELFYNEGEVDDPPLKSVNLNKGNNYEVTLTKGKDFEDFNYDALNIDDRTTYEVEEIKEVVGDTLNLVLKITEKQQISQETTTNTVTGKAEELVIGDDKATTSKNITSNVMEDREQKEKKEQINNRNKIYRIVFFCFLGLILIILIYIIIKFTQSNK